MDFALAGAELTTAEWFRVLAEAREMGAVQLGFSGGEPLGRPDLEELVAEASRLGFYTNLITSGVGLTETRIHALKQAGLDHIQLSFQDSSRELNDFLSSTRTFELKRRVATLIRSQGFPMVMNCVLHRLNIDHVDRIIDMALDIGVEFLELANTQYYGWAYLNRAQLLPSRAQLQRAEAVVKDYRQRIDDRLRILWVLSDMYETRPKRCMNGWGQHLHGGCAGWPGHAMPRRPHAARPVAALGARFIPARYLVRLCGLQPLPRRSLDARALPQLPGEGSGSGRLPLPGISAHWRRERNGSRVRQVATA